MSDLYLCLSLGSAPGFESHHTDVHTAVRFSVEHPEYFERTWRAFDDMAAALAWAEVQPNPMVVMPLVLEHNPELGF